jgi:hypothetical protein
MTLKGQARTDYMREYMRRRRGATEKQARPGGAAALPSWCLTFATPVCASSPNQN